MFCVPQNWLNYPRLEGVGGGFAAAFRGCAPKGRPSNGVSGKQLKIKSKHRVMNDGAREANGDSSEVSAEYGAFRRWEGVGGGLFWACLCFKVAENSP